MKPKKYLLDAIRSLSDKVPFEDITVEMILLEAGVSRGTFYKYFRDKYDLANSYYSEYVNTYILSRYDGKNWHILLAELFGFVKDNCNYFQTVMKAGRNDFLKYVSDMGMKGYSAVYKRNTNITEMNENELLELEFYNAGCIRIFEIWIKDNCRIPVKDIMQLTVSLIPDKYIVVNKEI